MKKADPSKNQGFGDTRQSLVFDIAARVQFYRISFGRSVRVQNVTPRLPSHGE